VSFDGARFFEIAILHGKPGKGRRIKLMMDDEWEDGLPDFDAELATAIEIPDSSCALANQIAISSVTPSVSTSVSPSVSPSVVPLANQCKLQQADQSPAATTETPGHVPAGRSIELNKTKESTDGCAWDLVIVDDDCPLRSAKGDLYRPPSLGHLLDGKFRRVCFVGHNIDGSWMAMTQKWIRDQSIPTIMENGPHGWSVAVLKHLFRFVRDARRTCPPSVPKMSDDRFLFITRRQLQVPASIDRILELLSKGANMVAENSSLVRVGTDTIEEKMSGENCMSFEDELLSFDMYYEAVCWRPSPPSRHVVGISSRMASISASRALSLPDSFYERAIFIHSKLPTVVSDRCFDYLVPTLFDDTSPPINE
jgi:hypothetical protein